MQKTNDQPVSVAAFYRERIAHRKPGDAPRGKASRPAHKNASQWPFSRTGVYEVGCILLSLFFLSTPASAGLSSVTIGADVKFVKFEIVKVLDQHFTVEMQAKAATPFETEEQIGEKTVLIL